MSGGRYQPTMWVSITPTPTITTSDSLFQRCDTNGNRIGRKIGGCKTSVDLKGLLQSTGCFQDPCLAKTPFLGGSTVGKSQLHLSEPSQSSIAISLKLVSVCRKNHRLGDRLSLTALLYQGS